MIDVEERIGEVVKAIIAGAGINIVNTRYMALARELAAERDAANMKLTQVLRLLKWHADNEGFHKLSGELAKDKKMYGKVKKIVGDIAYTPINLSEEQGP